MIYRPVGTRTCRWCGKWFGDRTQNWFQTTTTLPSASNGLFGGFSCGPTTVPPHLSPQLVLNQWLSFSPRFDTISPFRVPKCDHTSMIVNYVSSLYITFVAGIRIHYHNVDIICKYVVLCYHPQSSHTVEVDWNEEFVNKFDCSGVKLNCRWNCCRPTLICF